MAFGLSGLLGGGRAPDVEMPDGLPTAGGPGSPLVDAFLALQGQRLKDAVTAPRDALSGALQVFGPDGHPTAEAMDRASGLAGLAMTGSLPFKVPSGAMRSFGGAAAKDDPLAALDASLGHLEPTAPPSGPRRVDPAAASWDLYHGSAGSPDFARFDPAMSSNPAERGAVFLAPGAETASDYAFTGAVPNGSAEAGPRVFRATVEPGKTGVFDLAHLAETDPAFNARAREMTVRDSGAAHGSTFDGYMDGFRSSRDRDQDIARQAAEMGYALGPDVGTRLSFGYGHIGAAVERAKAQGLDTAVLRGLAEHGGDDQVIVLTPGRVRSHYAPDQILYSGGPAGALAGLPALTSSSDPKGSPVSAGLGAPSPLDGLSPELQAQILNALRTPAVGSPEVPDATFRGFQPATPPTGAPTPVVHGSFGGPAPEERRTAGRPPAGEPASSIASMLGGQMSVPEMPAAEAPARAPVRVPSLLGLQPPEMPEGGVTGPAATGSLSRPPARASAPLPAAPTGDASPAAPALSPRNVPLPPARPAEFGQVDDVRPVDGFDPLTGQAVSGKPRPAAGAAAAAAGAAPSGGLDLGGLFGRMNRSGLSDQLIAIGAGLLSGKNFGDGLGRGLENAQRASALTATTNLAQAKAAREQAALAGNVAIYRKYFPNATDQEALAGSGNSTVMTELLKRGLPPTETFKQETDDAGNIWQTNSSNGQRSLLKAGETDKAVSPVNEEDRARLGLPPGVYQRDANGRISAVAQAAENKTVVPVGEEERVRLGLPAGSYQKDANGKISPINPTGTTINMGAEKAQDATVGKAYGEYQNDLATKGRNAANTLNSLALMEQAMKTPGFYSGVGGEGVKRANQFLAALGVKDARAASAAEVFDALSNKVVLDGLGGSLGPGISNTDRDYIARTAPTLAQSQQGNADLIGVARSLAQRQQQVAKIAREYAASNGGRLDSGFDQRLEEFASSNPLFPQARETATASAPQEPPQGAPAGARQAPDGRWYVTDPNRPGKYLQVR